MTSFVCAATIIINLTATWQPDDQKILGQAQKRCIQLYADSPCLTKFHKRAEQTYWAICGQEPKKRFAWTKDSR